MDKKTLLLLPFVFATSFVSGQAHVGLQAGAMSYQSDMIEFTGKEHTGLLPNATIKAEKKLTDWFSLQAGLGFSRRNLRVTNKIVPGIIDPLFNRTSSNLDLSIGPKFVFPMQRAGLFAEVGMAYGFALADKTKYGYVEQNNMVGYPISLIELYDREEKNRPGKPWDEIAISWGLGLQYPIKNLTLSAGISFFNGLTEIRDTETATGANRHNGKGFFVGVSRIIKN